MFSPSPDHLAALVRLRTLFAGHIAINGKTMRGSRDNSAGKGPLHVVRAWVDAQSLSTGQVVCAEKSNEIEAIPRLLDSLILKGAVITIDAAGCQREIAEKSMRPRPITSSHSKATRKPPSPPSRLSLQMPLPNNSVSVMRGTSVRR